MAALAVATVLVAASCSSDDTEGGSETGTADPADDGAGDAAATGDDSAPPTSDAPATTSPPTSAPSTDSTSPTTTTTSPPEPLEVLLIGDSLMIDTGPGATMALESAAEPVDATVELFPAMPRSDEDIAGWQALVEAADPDVVVVFIGTWEGLAAFAADVPPVGEPGFEEQYRTAVLAPWFDHLQGIGVHTIFLGSAPMPHPLAHERIQITVDATDAEVAGREGVDFVRADTVLGGPGGEFVEVLPDRITGTPERIRRVADVHLCVDGVEHVVDLILERMALVADLTIDDAWRDGPWRTEDLPYDPVEGCPPV